ncbi:hypothetical protein SAMN05421770_101696 [Granulicella rosea]|uniref:Uncharacterized protein n=1 Tax=Granulicella rosea TaxID=474952 RepID=A0A239DXR2_9BACT|nr:hypothetical protein [Granulicella rosea]SNS37127.1 hypothetical protein SAMN05421770_101696 [Granulicella rosea]
MIRPAIAALLTLSLTAAAQTAASIPPPTTGILTQYTYWPNQFVEFVGDELPYSMLEVDVDQTGKQPIYNVVLTQRPSGKRITYSNSDALVMAAKFQGGEAYKVAMAFEWDGNFAVGNTASIRFTMADEKPFEFHFVQGSDVSEQGSGLTDLHEIPLPVLAYRELGAVAGEGTALQIGNVSAPAEVWKEISKPPYFVGYRGAMTVAAHRIVLYPGTESWKIASAPTTLNTGSAWELDGDRGAHRTIRIDKVDGAHVTVTTTDARNPGIRVTTVATRTADAWAIESARYAPVKDGDKHSVTLQFTPASIDFIAGRKTKFATASIAATGATQVVTMKSPDWAKGKSLTEETVAKDGVFTVTAK